MLHETLMTEAQAAERLGRSKAWLAAQRLMGRGPVHVWLGNRVMYDPVDIDRWIESLKSKGDTK